MNSKSFFKKAIDVNNDGTISFNEFWQNNKEYMANDDSKKDNQDDSQN